MVPLGGLLISGVCGLIGTIGMLLIVAILIRGAVVAANKCIGPSDRPQYLDEEDEEDWDAYDQPARRGRSAIPVPGVGKGMIIALIVFVVVFVFGIIITFVDEEIRGGGRPGGLNLEVELLCGCFGLIAGFLICTAIFAILLPTSFGRACLVTLFICLIALAIVGVVGLLLFAIGMVAL